MKQYRQLFALFSLLGIGLVQAASDASAARDEAVIRVREVLDRPEFPLVRVAGVCDITADGAKCWDGQGKPFASLGERVTAYYMAQSTYTLSIRPGVKNRWVVMEREQQNAKASYLYTGLSTGNNAGSILNWREGMMLEWYRLDLLKEDKVASVQVKFLKEAPGVQLPLKKGASAELDGVRFSIDEFGALPRESMTAALLYMAPAAKYRIRVKRQVLVAGHHRHSGPTLLDSEGNAIRQVDENGKPLVMGSAPFGTGSATQLTNSRRSPEEDEYATNVNPRYISGLKYGKNDLQAVEFEQIPLDPISGSGE